MRLSDILAVVFGMSVLSEVAYYVYVSATRKKKRRLSKKAQAFGNQVIFFPDRGVACAKAIYDDSDTCGNPNCCFLHGPTSLRTLVYTLTEADRTLDVCVYMITCDTLGNALLSTHHRGRAIRVITEAEGADTPGSQIGRLRKAGIQVRVNNHSSYLMHHKFALVDREVLISGSFNWTRQAITAAAFLMQAKGKNARVFEISAHVKGPQEVKINPERCTTAHLIVCGNHENLLLTAEPDVVDSYVQEFARLWELFKPHTFQVPNPALDQNAESWEPPPTS